MISQDHNCAGCYARAVHSCADAQPVGQLSADEEVTTDDFLNTLEDRGCKALFYVEFVPISSEMKEPAPGDEEREYMEKRLAEIRAKHRNMIFLSFPGDEKSLGGCIAAGRGFFHINSHGGAEPCPFSPYSDVNVRDTSLREALHSELFMKLQSSGTLTQEHIGGCVLYENRDKVENCLMQNKKVSLRLFDEFRVEKYGKLFTVGERINSSLAENFMIS